MARMRGGRGRAFDILGALTGTHPNELKSLAVDQVEPNDAMTNVLFDAYEQTATADTWSLQGIVICAFISP